MTKTNNKHMHHRPLMGPFGMRTGVPARAGLLGLCCAGVLALGATMAPVSASTTDSGLTAPAASGISAAQLSQAMLFQRLQAARALPPDRRAQARREILQLLLNHPAPGTVGASPAIQTAPKGPVVQPGIDAFLDLIAEAEAGPAGYDAVQRRAVIPPPKPPTQMTLAEIQDWIAATPRQQHAIGRYQIIPDTLAYLIATMALPPDALFDAALQDRMALRLLDNAGLDAFLRGEHDPHSFMDAVAMIWAGLPLRSGLSAYHGYNGNRATISRETYETRFARIFP